MFINDKLIYLQMQKTGCSHITRLLERHAGGQELRKHAKLKNPAGERAVIGSVRNPWAWYVSLWAFGCAGNGSAHAQLTDKYLRVRKITKALLDARGRNRADILTAWPRASFDDWRALYGDPEDVDLFRGWLKRLFGEGRRDIGDGYQNSGLSHFAGYMTYEFAAMYTQYPAWEKASPQIVDRSALDDFWNRNTILDHTIRTESLESDLSTVLSELGYASAVAREGRTNTSRHLGWREYYDDETADLVGEQESFIAETFGYKNPRE